MTRRRCRVRLPTYLAADSALVRALTRWAETTTRRRMMVACLREFGGGRWIVTARAESVQIAVRFMGRKQENAGVEFFPFE
jgi:hypothetical protein